MRQGWPRRLGVAAGRWPSLPARPGARRRPPEPPVFRAQVEAVYVDVFVTRSGQPVPGLRASDFELRDNRVAQEVELLSAEMHPILAVLVFDTSSSMDGERIEALRAAGEAFLGGLRPADQAALVSFSEKITWLAEATTDKAAVGSALAKPPRRGRHFGVRRALHGHHLVGLGPSALDRSLHRRRRQRELARRAPASKHGRAFQRARARRGLEGTARLPVGADRAVGAPATRRFSARSPRPPEAASGARTPRPACVPHSARWPIRCGIATSCATRRRGSSARAGTGSRCS